MTQFSKLRLVADVLARRHFQKYAAANQQMAAEGIDSWSARSAIHFEQDAQVVLTAIDVFDQAQVKH